MDLRQYSSKRALLRSILWLISPLSVIVPNLAFAVSPPSSVSAVAVRSTQVHLFWSPEPGGAAGYKIFRDGSQVGIQTDLSALAYADVRLTPSTTYTYTVTAYDSSGTVSSPSISVTVKTLASVIPTNASTNRTFDGKRAVYLEQVAADWGTPAMTDTTLSQAKSGGFNVVIPLVWDAGTYWLSQYAPWSSDVASQYQATDPLKYLIQKAHSMGIEVHPWLMVAYRGGASLFPEFAPLGTPQNFFDVHNPGFQQLMANLAGELVTKYQVDGIHLDFVRTGGECNSSSCIQEYRQKYGKDLAADYAQARSSGGPPSLYEFAETSVTSLVKAISDNVRSLKPSLPISAYVLDGGVGNNEAQNYVVPYIQGQHSGAWVNAGLVDVIARPLYGMPTTVDQWLYAFHRRTLNNPEQLILVSDVPASQALAQILTSWLQRDPNTGLIVYRYKDLTDAHLTTLKNGPFSTPSSPDLVAPRAPIGLILQ